MEDRLTELEQSFETALDAFLEAEEHDEKAAYYRTLLSALEALKSLESETEPAPRA